MAEFALTRIARCVSAANGKLDRDEEMFATCREGKSLERGNTAWR